MTKWNWDKISQIWIILFGATAIYLVGRIDDLQKWGYVCGIISQPAWFITTYMKKQWGIFILSIFYAFSWINGMINHFSMEFITNNIIYDYIYKIWGTIQG